MRHRTHLRLNLLWSRLSWLQHLPLARDLVDWTLVRIKRCRFQGGGQVESHVWLQRCELVLRGLNRFPHLLVLLFDRRTFPISGYTGTIELLQALHVAVSLVN